MDRHLDRLVLTCICLILVPGVCKGQVPASPAGPPVQSPASVRTDALAATQGPVVSFEGSWTQYVGSAVSGPADADPRWGGRFDATVVVSGRAFGASDALKINLLPECVYGENVNGAPGASLLLPLNSGLQFPSPDGEDCDLALNAGYKFANGTSVTVGKINTQANSRATPLVGGGSLDGFQHGFLPTPPTFISQRTLLGVLVTIPTRGPSITLGLWDPISAVNRSGLHDAFAEGLAGQVVLSFAVKPRGLDGNQKLTLMGSTQEGLDFDTLPDADLPPGSDAFLQRSGRWHLQYSFHQYLAQDPEDRSRGWGVFGRFGVWDGNPTPFQRMAVLGVIGNPPTARRQDRFGLAWFILGMSDDLKRALEATTPIGSESGLEAFYTFDFHSRLRLTANAQYVDPAFEHADRSLFIGLRAHVPF